MILVKNKKEICKKMVKGMAVGMTAMLLVETAVNAASVEMGDKDFTEKDRIVTMTTSSKVPEGDSTILGTKYASAQGICSDNSGNIWMLRTDNDKAGLYVLRKSTGKFKKVKEGIGYLGHANDVAYKGDKSNTDKGLYVVTNFSPSEIKSKNKDGKKSSVVRLNMDGTVGKKFDLNMTVGGIAYDSVSKRFILKEAGTDKYHVGYFKKADEGVHGSFVKETSFKLSKKGYSDYIRQGICFKDGYLYTVLVKTKNMDDGVKYVSSNYEDSGKVMCNKSVVLKYNLSGTAYKEYKVGKKNASEYYDTFKNRIKKKDGKAFSYMSSDKHISELTFLNESDSQAGVYESDADYKFEVEGVCFVDDVMHFWTNEKYMTKDKYNASNKEALDGLYALSDEE